MIPCICTISFFFINDFVKRELDNYLHQNPDIAESLLKRIMQSERERKDMAGIKKLANQRAKKANLHNKKLRDCKVHLNDEKADEEKRLNSTIFITEGDSASGSITKARDVHTQAVFSLRGKPLNSFGMKKKVVYENEEFNLLCSTKLSSISFITSISLPIDRSGGDPSTIIED